MKPLKLPNDDKSFKIFANRLAEAERKAPIEKTKREETDAEVEARFAKLREARAKERYGPVRVDGGKGNPLTYGDVWDEITDEEIDYYSGKSKPPEKRISPELRYQMIKKHLHYEGHDHACNRSGACVPTCRFYPEYGRVEDEEVFARWEKVRRWRDSTTREEKRAARQRVHNNNLVYDDD